MMKATISITLSILLLTSFPVSSSWFGNSITSAFGYTLGETYTGPSRVSNPPKPVQGFSKYHVSTVNNKIYSVSGTSHQTTLHKVLKALEEKYGKFDFNSDTYGSCTFYCGEWTFRDKNRKITIYSPMETKSEYGLSYLDLDLFEEYRKKIGMSSRINSDSL